ncbi:MAG: hypothetical protein ACSHX9_05125 [Luteolibacter sp.]
MKRIAVIIIILAGFTAALFRFFGYNTALWISAMFGGTLERVSNGKFSDPVIFVHGRIHEALVLFFAAVVISFLTVLACRFAKNFLTKSGANGLVNSILAFVALNIFAWFCGNTVLFWSLFYNKTHVDNFAQYQIKRGLMDEIRGSRRAILIGNSQTNRSIDEVAMNTAIGTKLWTTELTQPGARGFDMLILSRDIPFQKGDLVISYVSEISFYATGSGIVAADFLHFGEIPDLIEMDGWDKLSPGSIRSGLLGRVLPIHRFRKSLSHRILGWEMTGIPQSRHDASLVPDLDEQAADTASRLKIGSASNFEKRSFARMARELVAKGCSLIVIRGDLHPALHKRLGAGIEKDMDDFLESLGSEFPESITVIDGSTLAATDEGAFGDLVHFTAESQAEFTSSLIETLEPVVGSFSIRDLEK